MGEVEFVLARRARTSGVAPTRGIGPKARCPQAGAAAAWPLPPPTATKSLAKGSRRRLPPETSHWALGAR